MKRIISVILILTLILTSAIAVQAEEKKDETIYSKLNIDGSVEATYIVTHLYKQEASKEFHDITTDVSITNLSNSSVGNITEEGTTWQLDSMYKDFYYQSNSSKELPYKFDFEYFLNGKEISGEELAGKSGDIRIHLLVEPNESIIKEYEDSLMVQVTLSLDIDKVSNVKAEKSTAVIIGKKMILNFVVLPNSQDIFDIEFEGEDFEMDSWKISILPYSISMPDFLEGDMGELDGGFEDMISGMSEIINGSTKLQDGLFDLSDGVDSFHQGYEEFLKGTDQLVDGLKPMAYGVSSLSEGLSMLALNSEKIHLGLDGINSSAKELVTGYLGLSIGYSQLATGSESLNQLALEHQSSQDTTLATLANGILGMQAQLKEINSQLEILNSGNKAMSEGLEMLTNDYASFNEGISESSVGSVEISQGMDKINSTLDKYKEGAHGLEKGLVELKGNVNTIPLELSPMIDGEKAMRLGIVGAQLSLKEQLDMYSSEDIQILPSFIYGNEQVIESIQFILKVPEMKTEKKTFEKPIEANTKETIWDRIKALFIK